LDDYDQIRRLALAHSLDFPPPEHWQSLWRENPLMRRLGKDWPIGWVLENECGDIVGNFGSIASLYTFAGNELISAAGRFWFVTAPYRGFALQLMDEYLSQPGVDLFINNAVSKPALETFSRLLQPVPLGQWDTMSYFNSTPRAVPDFQKSVGSYTIDAADRFDSRFDIFWDELRHENANRLLAQRTSEALSWHFAIPMNSRRLWVFTASRGDRLRAYCTLTRQDCPFSLPPLPLENLHGPTSMRLVDYQTIENETDLLPLLLWSVLERCIKEQIDILENFGRDVPKMHALDNSAPFQQALSNWKFFFLAVEPGLLEKLSAPECWDPSAYDGEASFE
jgi:hypothetical protein